MKLYNHKKYKLTSIVIYTMLYFIVVALVFYIILESRVNFSNNTLIICDKVVKLDKTMVIKNSKILFNHRGCIDLNGHDLSIISSEIVISENTDKEDKVIISNKPSRLAIDNCTIISRRIAPKDGTSRYIAPYIVCGSYSFAKITNNRFENANIYGSGFLKMDMGGKGELIFLSNSIYGYHGAVNISNIGKAIVEDNYLFRNSNVNFYILGKSRNLVMKRNTILLSGNGTEGDGITIYGVLENSKIIGNIIDGGTCYGIWSRAVLNNVFFERNIIMDGVTVGLAITPNDGGSKHVVINENVLGNIGGLAVYGIDHLTVSNNLFQSGIGFSYNGYQLGNNTDVKWEGNLFYRDQRYNDIVNIRSHGKNVSEVPLLESCMHKVCNHFLN